MSSISPGDAPGPQQIRHFVRPGEIVAGRYRVGDFVEVSPRGTFYRAKHASLGFGVTLQVLGPEVARDSLTWRRFARELRALGALHNQHVVRVHDAGTLPRGVRFLITEPMEGEDLASALGKGPLPTERAVDYLCQVCSALSDAHGLGIVHRNVRPENVFLARSRAAQPVVKLLDFGVALFLSDPGPLTIPGCGVVSPAYLSPEQLRNPNAVDHRSDLWAVGLLAFEALVGHSPFTGFSPTQTLRALSAGPMPLLPLSCPGIPRALALAVQQCLEREPTRRPGSADELIRMLEPFSSRPGAARPAAARSEAARSEAVRSEAAPAQPQAPLALAASVAICSAGT
jgi:eukaryotic-like serine/threonine-protein kinase